MSFVNAHFVTYARDLGYHAGRDFPLQQLELASIETGPWPPPEPSASSEPRPSLAA